MAETTTERTDAGPWRIERFRNGNNDAKWRLYFGPTPTTTTRSYASGKEALAEADRLNARERQADAAPDLATELRRVEWMTPRYLVDGWYRACATCRGIDPSMDDGTVGLGVAIGHHPDCTLAAALAKYDAAKAEGSKR